MRLTFIISIDPVKGVSLLNVLLHSLNLQTRKNFDVVFYNQTLLSESEVFAQLQVRPEFNYRFFKVLFGIDPPNCNDTWRSIGEAGLTGSSLFFARTSFTVSDRAA